MMFTMGFVKTASIPKWFHNLNADINAFPSNLKNFSRRGIRTLLKKRGVK